MKSGKIRTSWLHYKFLAKKNQKKLTELLEKAFHRKNRRHDGLFFPFFFVQRPEAETKPLQPLSNVVHVLCVHLGRMTSSAV